MGQHFYQVRGIGGIGDPWINLDGRLNAPVGVIQLPTQLNTYHPGGFSDARYFLGTGGGYQAPWHVAGIDYPVGCPTNITLKIPQVGWSGAGDGVNFPLGFTYSNLGGFNNCVQGGGNSGQSLLDGWDFSAGYQILVADDNSSMTDITIQNCKILMNGMGGITAKHHTGNALVQYCTFDGNNGSTPIDSNNAGALLNLKGQPSFPVTNTIKYCLFKNAFSDLIDFGRLGGIGNFNFDIRYNLLWNSMQGTGDIHPDFVQNISIGNLGDIFFNFNTCVQDMPAGDATSGTQGVGLWGSDGTGGTVFGNGSCSNNTFIGTANANIKRPTGSSIIWMMDYAVAQHNAGATLKIASNFFDPTGMINGTRGTPILINQVGGTSGVISSFVTVSGNINMLDGSAPTVANGMIAT